MPLDSTVHPRVIKLSKSHNFLKGRFKDFVNELLVEFTKVVRVDRAAYWLYDPAKKTFNLVSIYFSEEGTFSTEGEVSYDAAPTFFEFVLNRFVQAVENVEEYEELNPLKYAYANTTNALQSVLTQQVYFNGSLLGLLSFENTEETRNWTNNDMTQVSAAASLIQQAYQSGVELDGGNIRDAYQLLFKEAPLPIWVFDSKTLEILDGNRKAIELYGYNSLSSFRGTPIKALMTKGHERLSKVLLSKGGEKGWNQLEVVQQRSDGFSFLAKLSSSSINFKNRQAQIVVVIDSKKEKKIQKEKDELERRLTDHATYASHNLRSPVANILGILDLINVSWDDRENYEELLYRLKIQTMNLDEAVRVMNTKVEVDQLRSGV